jgi:hypothetical protein
MSADFDHAIISLRENLVVLEGNRTPERTALWNLSNALLVVCDALMEIDARVQRIDSQTKIAR